MIVADTGAIVALIDGDDAHHAALVELYNCTMQGQAPGEILEVEWSGGESVFLRRRRSRR